MNEVIVWQDPQVIASLIDGAATILAATITAIVAGWIGRRWLNQEKLREYLATAKQDIHFLLIIEQLLYDHLKEKTGHTSKHKFRAMAIKNGVKWSGFNTLSRVRRRDDCS